MSSLSQLSRREREIMEIVYGLGHATVTEVLERLEKAPTRPALRSLLGILEDKGQLRHDKRGREFVYHPVVEREVVGRGALRRVVETFFGGSLESALVAHLSDPAARYSEEEVSKMKRYLDEATGSRGASK